MKVMVTWQMYPGELHETLGKFATMSPQDEAAAMGPDVKLIGRWHDVAQGRGVAIFETDNAAAISGYALNWNGAMDLETSIVLDDEETRTLGQSLKG
jgi:hypothetical protein